MKDMRGQGMRFSVIIPVKEINGYILESCRRLREQACDDLEVIVFPDRDTGTALDGARIIATGPAGPAEKRDLAIKYATGDILAFLDDDAYPRRDWLKNAAGYFKDERVAAVGGPAVTPESDTVLQKASGAVFSSPLTSAGYVYRYVSARKREVDDFPTVNFLVRKSVFERLGGFDTGYWPGEDTKLCLDITKKLGLKIIYAPDVLVYHHRRPLFVEHLRQVSRYAYQRGCFAKLFPETSLRLSYFVPTLFLMFLATGPVAAHFSSLAGAVYEAVVAIYLAALVLFSAYAGYADKSILVGALTLPGIFFTHMVYGFNFIRGFVTGHRSPRAGLTAVKEKPF